MAFELYSLQERLNLVSHLQYLGVTYDENLTWSFHIVNIAARGTRGWLIV